MYRTNRHALAKCILLAISGLGASPLLHAGDVTGVLVDPESGKALANAQVTLTPTGKTARTDSDGHFAFSDLDAGSYTLTAQAAGAQLLSGSAEVTQQGTTSVKLSHVTSLGKVSVAANTYDAVDMQMGAANTINVLSANDLQTAVVHNVAEALGLLPGVNVTYAGTDMFAGIDGASRGEGMFTSVRGLNAEYNVNLINGVNVAQGMPYSRGVQLSLLPPSGLQTIVLNKTSTADMDGDAIGGTIDFRTPTAFDFTKDTSGSITTTGRVESRERDYGNDGLSGGASGEFQTKFGDEHQFGVYVSGYYDKHDFLASEVAASTSANDDGSWAFARTTANGKNPPGVNPESNFISTGTNLGTSEGTSKRYGGNMSLDWKVDDTLTAYARASYAVENTQQNTNYLQIIPSKKTYTELGTSGLYQPVINTIATRYWYETNPEHADLGLVQFGADKQVGSWTFSPNVFYGYGDNDLPDHVEISARNDEYSSTNFPYGGSQVMNYGANGFPYPMLTPAINAQLNSVATMYARRAGEQTDYHSGQQKAGAKFDAHYDIDSGALSSIQMGVKYVNSHREYDDRDWTTPKYTDYRDFGSLGLIDGYYSNVFPGKYDYQVPIIDQDALKRLIAAHITPSALDSCSAALYENNYNCNTQRGNEGVSSAYVMGTLKWGALEVIPGFRFEHTDINNTFWVMPKASSGPEQLGYFAKNYTHYDEPLPSIFVNYTPSDNAVYRASIWTSYTRPAFIQLGGGSQVNVSSDGVTTITVGNPNLKSIHSTNFDISGEWRNQSGGNAMVAGFYKKLSDYIYDAGSSQANSSTSDAGAIHYVMPTNGGDGTVYGVEAALRQKFIDLPGFMNGFGVGANVTEQHTKVDLGMTGFSNERIQSAPNSMANAELFYEKYGFSVNLTYQYTGAYIINYDYLNQGAPWDDLWMRPISRIDLHAGYDFHNGLRADLTVSNLTKNYSYWAHIGQSNLNSSQILDAGMTTMVNVKYTF